jgi:hypothetical protein
MMPATVWNCRRRLTSRVLHGCYRLLLQVHAGLRMCGVRENAALEVLNSVNIICDGSTHILLTK